MKVTVFRAASPLLCLIKKESGMKNLLQYNLSFVDISIRYAIIIALGILFGVTQFYPLIVLAVLVFISAVTGMCPIYSLLGINHASETGNPK